MSSYGPGYAPWKRLQAERRASKAAEGDDGAILVRLAADQLAALLCGGARQADPGDAEDEREGGADGPAAIMARLDEIWRELAERLDRHAAMLADLAERQRHMEAGIALLTIQGPAAIPVAPGPPQPAAVQLRPGAGVAIMTADGLTADPGPIPDASPPVPVPALSSEPETPAELPQPIAPPDPATDADPAADATAFYVIEQYSDGRPNGLYWTGSFSGGADHRRGMPATSAECHRACKILTRERAEEMVRDQRLRGYRIREISQADAAAFRLKQPGPEPCQPPSPPASATRAHAAGYILRRWALGKPSEDYWTGQLNKADRPVPTQDRHAAMRFATQREADDARRFNARLRGEWRVEPI